MQDAESANLQTTLEAARLYSSGPYSSADLTALGHPYATRAPAPLLPAGIINEQSDVFLSSWETEGPTEEGGALSSAVWNTALYAPFLDEGTELMIPRPLPEAVVEEVQAEVEERRLRAIEEAFP